LINLFQIPKVDLSIDFDNVVHGKIVREFEERFAAYVGAKYSCSTVSATAAIFLALRLAQRYDVENIATVPSLITTRFLSTIIHSGMSYEFTDNVFWVGNTYELYDGSFTITDSAQRVEYNINKDIGGDLCIYSFYPTKPVSGICGGMIVSDDEEKITWLQKASHFGENFSAESWKATPEFMGWQKFMTSPQAYVALENLKTFPDKRNTLNDIRFSYINNLKCDMVTQHSDHLFRIRVKDNVKLLNDMEKAGVVCGIHYKPAHLDKVYGKKVSLPKSERDGNEVVSIPFHEFLTANEIDKVIELVNKLST